jgi:serine/threonine protein kinase
MDPEAQAASRVGTTLCNKWMLEKLLGVGGMAAVYVATHKIGRREAIKLLHPEVARSPELRARFEQEAHLANRFRHPGAVEIRDIDVTPEGTPFLVMELLEGESLAERAKRLGTIELGELYRFVDELLDVLAAAHAQGIVHRDIKLDNLFVQTDGRIKVLDFGIARIRDGLPRPLRTRVGATLGTTPYMPPEQIKGLSVDARADLFAVGATMFRLIARRRLHEAATEPELLVKMASLQAPALCSVAPDAPRDAGLVVDRALMFRREQRYPDALAMQQDVRALRAGVSPPNASRMLLEPEPPLEVPSIEGEPWTTGEVGAPLAERTAAASPDARENRGESVEARAPISIAAATVQEGRQNKPEQAPASAVGVEASLPMPPSLPVETAPTVLHPAVVVVANSPSSEVSTSPLAASVPVPSATRSVRDTPPITSHEPTLKSPGGAAPVTAQASPPAIAIVAPPPRAGAAASVRTLPEGELPPLEQAPPAKRSQLLKLVFVAVFFLLLGVTLTLLWAFQRRPARLDRRADEAGSEPLDPSRDQDPSALDGGAKGAVIRPKPTPVVGNAPVLTASPTPVAAPPGHGKGKGKGK